jgi:hypothetical protein
LGGCGESCSPYRVVKLHHGAASITSSNHKKIRLLTVIGVTLSVVTMTIRQRRSKTKVKRARHAAFAKTGPENKFPVLFADVHPLDQHMIEGQERTRPWQFMAADYEVRPGHGGVWGIYLRKYNVCLATFAPNSAALRDCLSRCFDAAYTNKKVAVAKFREDRGI